MPLMCRFNSKFNAGLCTKPMCCKLFAFIPGYVQQGSSQTVGTSFLSL